MTGASAGCIAVYFSMLTLCQSLWRSPSVSFKWGFRYQKAKFIWSAHVLSCLVLVSGCAYDGLSQWLPATRRHRHARSKVLMP